MRRLWVPVLFAVLAVMVPATPAADAGDGPLFSPAAAPVGRAADVHARRERFVTVEPGVLLAAAPDGSAAGAVAFNLFDDTILTGLRVDLQVRGPGDFTWVGRVGTSGTAVVTVRDGAMVGRIADPEQGTFAIKPAEGGVHAVAEVDPASYPVEVDIAAGLGQAGEGGGTARDAATGATIVTVLVVYTASTAAGMGGTAAIEALAANVVAETNLAYQDSGVIHRLELVGTRGVSYQESDQSNTNLHRLTGGDDDYLDEVHRWRDEAAADLVVLIVSPMSDFCGSAWIMVEADPSFADQAFAVVSWDCARDNLSFAHETGHLFGANHEPQEAGQAIYRYAHAYVDCVNGFRTIMAYGSECPVRPPRVAQFSSPDHPHAGFPAGDDLHDNARTLNETAPVVALFRSPAALCAGRPATIEGTDGPDELTGTPGPDVIHALGGDDVVYGRGGDDVICGGAGNDTIFPGGGVDEVYGEWGSDRFEAGPGVNGTVDGGPGQDLVDFADVTAAPVLGDLATGQFTTGPTACTVRRVERVVGSALDDDIRGDDRRNAIWGGPGNDSLAGGGGADLLQGGPGDDIVLGGAGNDLLRGGPGDDAVYGQGQSDRVYGDGGADDLRGGAGDDLLHGDNRDVGLVGGDGEDLCSLGGEAPSAC